MTKQKTRKELDENPWIMIAIVGWIFFITLLGLSTYTFETIGRPSDLKQQLSECQDQVEVWTLKIVCDDLFFGKGYYEKDYTDYQEYLDFLDVVKRYENCEVIE